MRRLRISAGRRFAALRSIQGGVVFVSARIAWLGRVATGAILPLVLIGCLDQAPTAEQSTFEQSLRARPAIAQPSEPFVLIFHDGDSERNEPFGLKTEGVMERSAWRRIYEHIGHLAPYAIYRPDRSVIWRRFDRHLALEAARSLGRPNGGSIFALPSTPEQEDNLRRAYRDPIGLGITHFFHDIEGGLGTPGGTGQWRARDLGEEPARLESAYNEAFDTGIGSAMESFTMSFGVGVGAHVYGGDPQILELGTAGGSSFSIAFDNRGGRWGTNHFVFRTDDGEELASSPIEWWLGRQWHQVAVSVDGAEGGDRVRVTLSVAGLDDVTTTLPRPVAGPRQLRVGGAYRHSLSIDDLVISGRVDGRARILAKYGFGSPQAGQPAMTEAVDDSGNGHTLRAPSGFIFLPTTGVRPERYAEIKRWLVDELLAARAEAGEQPPQVLTNWRVSERPHRLATWRPVGFTHGNTVYYLYEPPTGVDELVSIFEHGRKSVETQWAWQDGSPWSTVWVGHVHSDKAVLTPEQYRSLIALAVLDGNRCFVVFTGMSDGHLGREGLSRGDAARINAASLYAMAEAASWFQSTSGALANSRYLGDAPLLDRKDGVIFRARTNDASGELWFAGAATGGSERIRVQLTGPRGTLTNLATGELIAVVGEIVNLTLNGGAEPYHFAPAP